MQTFMVINSVGTEKEEFGYGSLELIHYSWRQQNQPYSPVEFFVPGKNGNIKIGEFHILSIEEENKEGAESLALDYLKNNNIEIGHIYIFTQEEVMERGQEQLRFKQELFDKIKDDIDKSQCIEMKTEDLINQLERKNN